MAAPYGYTHLRRKNFPSPKQKAVQTASGIFSYLAQGGVINLRKRPLQSASEDLSHVAQSGVIQIQDPISEPTISSSTVIDISSPASPKEEDVEIDRNESKAILRDENEMETEYDLETEYEYEGEVSDCSYVPESEHSDSSSSSNDGQVRIVKHFGTKSEAITDHYEDHEDSCDSDASTIVPTIHESTYNSNQVSSSSVAHKNKDIRKVMVLKHNNMGGKRKWDKKHCCVYCSKMYAKLSRHLKQMHKDELEVAQALSHKKRSKERKAKLKLLLHRGDFKHNKMVALSKEGFLIPAKRQITDGSIHDYTTCERCLGLFLRKDLWRHKKKCATIEIDKSPTDYSKSKNRNLLFMSVGAFDNDDQNFKEKILDSMNCDNVSLLCRQDQIILQFGRNMFNKVLDQQHQFQYIKYRMREIARFVLEMRKHSSEIQYLSDCICPLQFKTIIKVVKQCAKFDMSKGIYQTPSVALKLGHSIRACAAILKSMALQAGDDVLEKRADSFVKLYSSDWSHAVSSRALQTLHKRKFNSARRIPLANDVKRLYSFLQTKADAARETLKSCPNPSSWKNLAELSLAQIVLFNRRRGGEMQRMKLDDYHNGLVSGKSLQGEIMQSLSSFERTLAENIERVEIRGKRGRRVPVLLTKYYKENIELLLDYRDSSGLGSENNFVFGRKGDSNVTLRTSDILRKFSNECGASQPQLLTSTALRKHIGTICQLLNLKENELEALATFMGHDKAVHKQYYRLPEDTMQLAKVSKILLQLEKGNIKTCKGKTLDDIQLEEDDTIADDEMSNHGDDDELSNDDGEEGGKGTSVHMAEDQRHKFVKSTVQKNTAMNTSNIFLKGTKGQRKEWSQDEKNAVAQEFGKFFYIKRLPGKSDIVKAMRTQPVLANRPWAQIKYYIKNVQSKNNKF